MTGTVTYGAAIPIIMGQNIGTCVTALISCVGASKNARRAAMIHLYFNLIGSLLFLGAFYAADAIFDFAFISANVTPAGIAVVHSAFNLITTAVMLSLSKLLERLACMTVRDTAEAPSVPMLDERLLMTPSIAVEHSRKVAGEMALTAEGSLIHAVGTIPRYDAALAEKAQTGENDADIYEDKLGNYLVKLAAKSLSDSDSREVSGLLHAIGDFERISDHARNIADVSKEMFDKNISFSDEANSEIKVLSDAVLEITDLTVRAFISEDIALAARVEPLEQVVDKLKDELRSRHIDRLTKGGCTIELGFIFSDLLTNYERVSDHCSNIAVLALELAGRGDFESHRYLGEVKTSSNSDFTRAYDEYKRKYELPV